MRIASSTSSKGTTVATGPNTSSRTMRIEGCVSTNTVGRTKQPPSKARLPPVTSEAPSATAPSMCANTRSMWRLDTSGPNCAFGSKPEPMFSPSATCASCCTTLSKMPRCTYTREPAVHTCPW
jgi:hypothetical protein